MTELSGENGLPPDPRIRDITHIIRSNVPWRSEVVTECGLDATKHPAWSRDEAIAKARELGAQRFSLFVCMNCKSTAERHATWAQDPASCLSRYTEKYQIRWRGESPEARLFNDELRAIALLVEAHRAEFDDLVAGLGATDSLSEARRRVRDRKSS